VVQWSRAKSLDTFGVLGPWIGTSVGFLPMRLGTDVEIGIDGLAVLSNRYG
jgi:2-keto-4-pentenoate hydratase/2-oxohepta-3-ene-1,7-dioic acid hydratase in catechol pathway